MSAPDEFWERFKHRHPKLADWDVIRDQSHVHHTLVISLILGPLGILEARALSLLLPDLFTWDGVAYHWASGVIGGIAAYARRERWPLLWFWKRMPVGSAASSVAVLKWDGTTDVVFPAAVLGPFAVVCLIIGTPWWILLLELGLLGAVALLYSFLRPTGSLFYGGRGLREDVCG